jgi:hypothetical protein
MIEITVQGSSWAHIRAQVVEMLGGPEVPSPKAQATASPKSEADVPEETAAAAEAKRRPGRPSNAEKEAAAARAQAAAQGGAKAEPETKAETKATNGAADAPSREDVVAALKAFADANGGQPAAREVMKKITGQTRLVDVAASDYGKLVEALAPADY